MVPIAWKRFPRLKDRSGTDRKIIPSLLDRHMKIPRRNLRGIFNSGGRHVELRQSAGHRISLTQGRRAVGPRRSVRVNMRGKAEIPIKAGFSCCISPVPFCLLKRCRRACLLNRQVCMVFEQVVCQGRIIALTAGSKPLDCSFAPGARRSATKLCAGNYDICAPVAAKLNQPWPGISGWTLRPV